MGTPTENEWTPMLVSWKVWTLPPREEKVLCKDERTYNALIGLLRQNGVKYQAQRIYTVEQYTDGKPVDVYTRSELVSMLDKLKDNVNKLHMVANADDHKVYIPINGVIAEIDKLKEM